MAARRPHERLVPGIGGIPPDAPADPGRFEEAIRAFRNRIPVGHHEFSMMDSAAREQAFKLASVAQGRMVQEVWDAIDSAIADGTDFTAFRDSVEELLTESWGGEDAPRMEALFRTEIMRSYNEGREEVFSDPVVREARPYSRVDSADDDRVCDICDPLDGTILPADDPWWDTHKFPLHVSCRCEKSPLSQEEAEEEGIDTEAPEAEEPQEGFGTGAPYDPDLDSFSPEIADALRERLDTEP